MQAGLMLRSWPRFVAGCRRRYGKVFTLRISGIGTLVYVDDPADIKAVFAGDPAIFHAGEANSMLAGLLGSSSVLVIDDDVHRERRRLVLAPFHRDAVARQAGVMAELAAENIASWPVGSEFAVAPRMSQLTLEVILRTVIGASDPQRLAELRAVMPKLLTSSAWQTLAVANPKLQRWRPWRAVRRHIAEADRLLYAEIADRRADPKLNERTDALASMILAGAMTDSQLRDQLMTLLVAGHDTTATALSWALERLTRHPDVLRKAIRAAHASAAGDPAGDEYLDAIGKEVLRIRPVVFDVGRVLTAPTDVAGYRLPAGRDGGSRHRAGARQRRVVPRPGTLRSRSDDRRDASARPRGCRSAEATDAVLVRRSRWPNCGSCCGRCCAAWNSPRRRRPTSGNASRR